jgi:hypothetical protein
MNLLISHQKFWFRIFSIGGIIVFLIILSLFSLPAGVVYAQQPTGSVPTVTGTPLGPVITVYSDQNEIGVFAGPSFDSYAQIGILVSGEKAPALGYSEDEKLIQIVYMGVPGGKGWIYGPYVSISPGSLPKLASPPIATPRTTPTIDPTYVAVFGVPLEPTRLPTFTLPPPLKIPTFAPDMATGSRLPFGLLILGLVLIGILGSVVSFLRGGR